MRGKMRKAESMDDSNFSDLDDNMKRKIEEVLISDEENQQMIPMMKNTSIAEIKKFKE